MSASWRCAGAYTFLVARYASDFVVCAQAPCGAGDLLIEDGHHIPGLSRHAAWAELRWGVDADTDIILDGRFVDRVYVDDSTDESAPGYAVFDLPAERRFEACGLQWRGDARLATLFDREYVGPLRVHQGTGRPKR